MTPNTGFFSESQEVDGPPSFMDSSFIPAVCQAYMILAQR